jgi:hypothetical protein
MSLDTNCEQCCEQGDILCVNIPGGIDIQLLGLNVEVCPICIRVFTETGELTDAQTTLLNQLLDAIRNLIPSV